MSSGGDPGGGDPHHEVPPVRVVRGVALVAVGVVIGVVLFHTVGRPQGGSVASIAAAPATSSTTTTAPAPTTTAAARPPAQVKTLVANVQAANVVVVVGPDLAGPGAPASGASTTSTTAHTTTTAHSTSSSVR